MEEDELDYGEDGDFPTSSSSTSEVSMLKTRY